MKITHWIVILWLLAHPSTAAIGLGGQRPLAVQRLPATDLESHSLLSLHKSLMERASTTGSESEVARFLEGYLQARGFTVELQLVEEELFNVFAYLGEARKTRILLTSPIDTVLPFILYERRGDEIWGRGSVDAKGSVAAQVTALESLINANVVGHGDVAMLFDVGKEKDGLGIRAANRLGVSWETVIFGEPTELKLARGHKGVLGFNITAQGVAGHSGYPELGRNAIEILVDGLSVLKEPNLPGSEEFGNTALNIGKLEGGVAHNVIAQSASAVGLIRVATYDVEGIKRQIRDALETASPWLDVTFSFGRGPVPIDSDIPGFDTVVVNYGTDIPGLNGTHRRYLYGPGSILVAYSDHEHLTVGDLEEGVQGYKILIKKSLECRQEPQSLTV